MTEPPYANREIDERFKDIKDSLDRIEIQTTKHNGRLTRLEKIVLVVGTSVAVLAISGNSNVLKLLAGFFI